MSKNKLINLWNSEYVRADNISSMRANEIQGLVNDE